MENLELLVRELIKLKNEVPWVEFKHNNYQPQMIGEDISALANAATLNEKKCAYMLWGIEDDTHEIVGTDYNLQNLKKGNQELENWLRSLLSDNADFDFKTIEIENKNVGILIIYNAISFPVKFEKIEYIRIGSYTKRLKDHPTVESQLWDKIKNIRFEEQWAKSDLQLEKALSLIDYSVYFELTNTAVPSSYDGIAHYLEEEKILIKQDNGLYAITNMGSILFAKKLSDFDKVSRKAIRVVQYEGNNRLLMLKENTENKGYAVGFEDLMKYVEALIPTKEEIVDSLRVKKAAYPLLAIREAVANALIHQDFSVKGTGPVIEIFESRIEITNAGVPLVDIMRIIDNPPQSRNEKLAELMRRLRMCEELGTGWDKIAISCELNLLPAPRIALYENNTRVILFSEIQYTTLPSEDRLWACYLHACIKYVQGEQLTNSSFRERFGLKESSAGSVSRLIKEAVDKQIIKPIDPDTAPRYMKYIPIWA